MFVSKVRYYSSVLVLVALVGIGLIHAQEPRLIAQVSDLANPESVIWWEEGSAWIVSNVQGNPGSRDGNGFLSLVGARGEMINKYWVTGLDAPKGMALDGQSLWVSDITVLRKVGHDPALAKGQVLGTIAIPGASFLNDVVSVRPGVLAVSDTQARAIFMLEQEVVTTLVQDRALGAPNGLAMDGTTLVLAQFAGASGSGGLLRVNLETGGFETIIPSLGSLDGLVITGSQRGFFGDFNSGRVQAFAGTRVTELWTGGSGTADIGWNPRLKHLAIPNMNRHLLTIVAIP